LRNLKKDGAAATVTVLILQEDFKV